MAGNRHHMPVSVAITLIIVGGILLLSETALIVLKPDASAAVLTDATTLAGLAVTTYATLRQLGKTNNIARENKDALEHHSQKLNLIGRNVNGNLSRLITFAEALGFDPEALEKIRQSRDELEVLIEEPNDIPEVEDKPKRRSLYS